MKYSEDQLTGWFDVETQKPWEPGLYQVKVEHMPEEDGLFSFFNGVSFKWISKSIDRAYEDRCLATGAVVTKWRGLSRNHNAKPKRSGNRKVTRYVVTECLSATGYGMPLATFRIKKNAQAYIEAESKMRFHNLRIDKIRFRTPEQD